MDDGVGLEIEDDCCLGMVADGAVCGFCDGGTADISDDEIGVIGYAAEVLDTSGGGIDDDEPSLFYSRGHTIWRS